MKQMPEPDPRVVAGLQRLLDERRRLLLSGARHIGWKMAFGAPAMMERLHLDAPAPGYLTDRVVLDDGSVVSLSGWVRPVIEFELALHLGEDIPAGSSPEEARRAVSGVAPAIELADVDLELEPDRVPDIVAGNIFNRAVILGEPSFAREGARISDLTAEILSGEATVRVTDFEALTGEYGWVLAHAATALEVHGARLRAGDLVIAGSVIPPIPINSPTRFTYEVSGFPPITVTTG